ncbi:SusC/RagA family TonB-linked outer membrane protein [Pontibacter silvestris]|uniref:SusC/RagA family TonB-linked outer membrane protein n=1 Tax=Pontibacter silvestris TaxID=2305183 RepID=A0ABW4X0C2_9BACT|nr:TonB-dependent receptor [Pontibacter silvestris]MCC9136028.1 TonB-dependent receptor [Pontibacter silvestris]
MKRIVFQWLQRITPCSYYLSGKVLPPAKRYTSLFSLLFVFLLLSVPVLAQNSPTVRGVVTDENGEGLPGVTVQLKGTTIGTATSIDGSYTIPVSQEGGTLIFSFIGYQTQEVPVNGRSTINTQLLTDAKALEEVVVVGYGTQKRSDLTGSVVAVSEKDFQKGQVTTPEQLIMGKVSGVQITSNGGAPGSGSSIRIRGGASLDASNDPLIVIDGVPVDNNEISGAPNPLTLINPNDIESFNVLKDASATAIYGSRASNGVIIITTKKGKAGEKLRVNFNTIASLSKVKKTIDVLSADEFRQVVNDNRGNGDNANLLGDANTDWQDLIFQDAFTTDNNLSVSGAYKSLPYRVSVGYLNQEGILKTSKLERSSAALSLNPTFLDDHLKVNLNVKGSLSNSRYADQGAIGAAVVFDPTQPARVEENSFGNYFEWTEPNGTPSTLAPRNPLSMLEQRNDKGRVKRSIGNIQLDYKFHFLPELRANLNLGYDVSEGEGSTTLPVTAASVYNQGGSYTEYEQTNSNKLLDFYFNYAKELSGIDSRIDVTAGYSYQNFLIKNPSFPVLTASGDVYTPAAPYPTQNENTLIGVFGRINYSFKNRYLLTANIRRDGSSRFSPNNKWGTFPSLALAWNISQEEFLKNVNVLSELKLRAGYGVTGQQDIGDYYPYLARYTYSTNTAMYPFGDQYYLTLRPAGYDENIKWEETEQFNIGLDYGFLNGKINGSIDYYFKKTKDLLSFITPAAGTNLTNGINTNVGDLESKGLEVAINYRAFETENFSWNVGVNGTYNDVTITRLSNVDDPDVPGTLKGGISGGTGTTVQIHSVGYTPFSYYVYKQVYDENNNPIEGLYEDLNEDGVINEQDLYRYKSPQANVYLGFNSDMAYKNWSLSFVLRANLGNYVYNNIYSNNGTYRNISNGTYLSNMSTNVLETNFQDPQYLSDYYVENASFLRMDNLNLGYDFGMIRDKANLRLTASVQNVFVITKYSGLDPEIGGGIDNNFYPRPRVFSLGANVSF